MLKKKPETDLSKIKINCKMGKIKNKKKMKQKKYRNQQNKKSSFKKTNKIYRPLIRLCKLNIIKAEISK